MGLHSATRHNPTIRINVDSAGGSSDFQFVPEDEEYDEDDGQCPECGTRSWSRVIYGRYSQMAYYTFGTSRYTDYDNLNTEDTDDADSWTCENGHYATDAIHEMLCSE